MKRTPRPTHRPPARDHQRGRRGRHSIAILITGILLGARTVAAAGIATDGSVGPATTLTGPAYAIAESLGTIKGNNLFHSFHNFSIGSGESATFSTSVSGNVISRVTGGTASTIQGTLALNASGGARPGFWFINPAGILFGAGASISMPGTFHAATADYIAFSDGSRFFANPGQQSSLTSAPAEAFGFLGNNRASLHVIDGATLSNGGDAITLAAGDIRIDNNATVATTDGDIRIIALGNKAAEVPVYGFLPNTDGTLGILRDSLVQTNASTAASGGYIVMRAGDIRVDDSVVRTTTNGGIDAGAIGIVSNTLRLDNEGVIASTTHGSGNAGRLVITVRDGVNVDGASVIATNTYATGNAGDLYLEAASLALRGDQSAVQSDTRAEGNAGNVSLYISGETRIEGKQAWISSDTYASGNGGTVALRTGTLLINAQGSEAGVSSEAVRSTSTGNAGAVSVVVDTEATLYDGARISSLTQGAGNAGSVTVNAGSLLIDGAFAGTKATGIISDSEAESSGEAGGVLVTVTGSTRLLDGGSISSSSRGSGGPGWLSITTGSLEISGANANGTASAIASDAGAASVTGFSGYISLDVTGNATLSDHGKISTNSAGALDAGYIFASIGGNLTLSDSASITSDATGSGNAGAVSVAVGGTANLTSATISSNTRNSGNAGSVTVTAAELLLDTTAITSDTFGSGRAGNVSVSVSGSTTIRNGAWISSDTYDAGAAGAVSVSSGSLLIDGNGIGAGISSDGLSGSTGNAGSVLVTVTEGAVMRNTGQISSTAYADGAAGVISVSAANLEIDGAGSGQYPTGILTAAAGANAGDAGTVIVESPGTLSLVRGGSIASSTFSSTGGAGVVLVSARQVQVDGEGSNISALASAGSSGRTGYVAVVSSDFFAVTNSGIVTERITVSNGGRIAITNDAIVSDPALITPGYIALQAGNIDVRNSSVTASSSGNIAAGNIFLGFADRLSLGGSQISTSSNEGDGGKILISGGDVVWLDGAQITTSVASTSNGNGGDIRITANNLAMQNGFIQANTNAPANGGNIDINVNTLIPAQGQLRVGGETPLAFITGNPGYNVIQAAAPDGVSGQIDITSPVLDLSGSLADLKAQTLQGGGLGRSPCDVTAGSSLAATGRGALPASARDPLRVEAPIADTPSPQPPATTNQQRKAFVLTLACNASPSHQ